MKSVSLILFSFVIRIYNVSTYFAEPENSRFVGMWWGGFFLCGLLLLFVALPFFFFPKALMKEKKNMKITNKNVNNDYGKDIKGNFE